MVEDILDVIRKQANVRQQMIFDMLAQGMTLEEIAEHVGVSVPTVHAEKTKIAALLKTQLGIASSLARNRSVPSRSSIPPVARAEAPQPPPGMDASSILPMNRVTSPLGGEIVAAMKQGGVILPTGGGYAGPVMTIKIPRAQLAPESANGIIMLPPVIIEFLTQAGEQQMVVAAAREIGDADSPDRSFALYAFCKDEHLDVPKDVSRYRFRSEVTDPKVVEIVTKSDFRRPEVISERLWGHYAGG